VNETVEQSVEETIKAFLAAHLLIDFTGDVDDNSDLFQLGLMDSYTYIELIRFVETAFALKFTNDEILSNVMVSLAGITLLVSEKMAVQV